MDFIKIDENNIHTQHICCAISDKKHENGVKSKKEWILKNKNYNHTFYKLNENGKVFIEYVDAEGAWASISAPNYVYIQCFWVSGKYKGSGMSVDLLNYCINDAKQRNKSGICVIVGGKKLPFLSDKSRLIYAGFKSVDKIGEYELLALMFDDNGDYPIFGENAKKNEIENKCDYKVFYTLQCPYILNCIKEMKDTAARKGINLEVKEIESISEAQSMPCVFNNFALFGNGKFITHILLNGNSFEKIIEKQG